MAVKSIKAFRSDPRDDIERLLLLIVAHRLSCALLHSLVTRAPVRFQAYFQRNFALAFMRRDFEIAPRTWSVPFCGKRVLVPLDGDVSQRWNFALSVVGHDTDVKALYRRMLASRSVNVFYDIGTNYGTHSILMLVHGVRTVSVEPNPLCRDFFLGICSANGVEPCVYEAALGEEDGSARLTFPPEEAWLGTVSPVVAADLRRGHQLVETEVPMRTLDAIIAAGAPIPDLIKIDTEGHELGVLRGAQTTLAQHRPVIVFESWRLSERPELRDWLRQCGYEVALPATGTRLSWHQFLQAGEGNFLAVPLDSSVP